MVGAEVKGLEEAVDLEMKGGHCSSSLTVPPLEGLVVKALVGIVYPDDVYGRKVAPTTTRISLNSVAEKLPWRMLKVSDGLNIWFHVVLTGFVDKTLRARDHPWPSTNCYYYLTISAICC